MNTATEDADTQGHTFHSSTLQATLQRREKHWISCSGPNGSTSSRAIGGIAPANAESKTLLQRSMIATKILTPICAENGRIQWYDVIDST